MPHVRPRPAARRLARASLASLALLAAPAAAHAAYVPSAPLDGPNAGIIGRPDVDLARDGTGAAAWERADGVYVSRFLDGTWGAPQLLGAGSQPTVAAGDGGRVIVAWSAPGTLAAVVAPNAAAGFAPPQPLGAGGVEPSADMSINGVGYVSFAAPGPGGSDLRVARLGRLDAALTVLPDALDLDQNRAAGQDAGRSQIAVSADGTALAAWGEGGQVIARRVFGTRVSTAPQVVSIPAVAGHAAGAADSPEVHIEDDSSYAWVTYRQALDDGHLHLVASRLVGSAFDPPGIVDRTGYPAAIDVATGGLAMNGRGEGMAWSSAGGGLVNSLLHDNTFFPGVQVGASGAGGLAAPALGETNDAPTTMYLTSSGPDGLVRAVSYRVDPAKRTVPGPEAPGVLSDPALGPIDEASGLDAAGDRAGDMVALFVQGTGDTRRLVQASFDRAPGAFAVSNSSSFRASSRPTLSWSASFELWGPVTYEVVVDGAVVGATRDTKLVVPQPLATGDHLVTINAIDRRGQRTAAPTKRVRIDTTAPTAAFKISGTRKARQAVKVTVTAADGAGGSGLARTRIDFGDRTAPVDARVASHRYAKRGKYTVRVSATDKAGNAVAVTRRVTIAK